MSSFRIAAGLAALMAASVIVSAPARAESVMKECGTEWKAAKTNNATNNQTWSEFLKDCRTRHASASAAPAAPVASPTPTVAAAPAAPTPAAPAPAPTRTRMAKAEAAPTGAGQFAAEAEAKGHCPTDTIVWVNTPSHKYHYAGDRYYGGTKRGAYMCEADAKAAGDIAAKSRFKPKA